MLGIEHDNVQSIVYRAYKRLDLQYLLLQIGDAQAAKRWLLDLIDKPLTPTGDGVHLNVAFTKEGLEELGIDIDASRSPGGTPFAHEFVEGMDTLHRQRMLGDQGASGPNRWLWGWKGSHCHVLVMVWAPPNDLNGVVAQVLTEARKKTLTPLPGIALERGRVLPGEREHFGFKDGISQPILSDGYGVEELSREQKELHVVEKGEFLLGHANQYGYKTPSPTVTLGPGLPSGRDLPEADSPQRRDFGMDGSYLVFRQLSQDVARFWGYLAKHSPGKEEFLGAKLVGRWRDGTPLVHKPHPGSWKPAKGRNDNDFGYHDEDRYGLRCPIGSHIRRANPRDGLSSFRAKVSNEVSKRHRILRRGRSYGPEIPVDSEKEGFLDDLRADRRERGLHFLCLNANLGRQFEFVQQSWLGNPRFNGLRGEVDPVVGMPAAGGGAMTVQDTPVRRRYEGLKRFVTMRGGAYFFLPSLNALDYLAHS